MTKDRTIYIKNIYYMLAYAFSALNQDGYSSIKSEPFDHLHDMMAAILAKGIATQLKQGLFRKYVEKTEDLSTVRGKIDMPGTIRNHLARRRVVFCDYDELSENNGLNQILKTTVMLLMQRPDIQGKYKTELKKEMLLFSGVDTLDPSGIRWSSLRYERNNSHYRMLIGICQLILEGMLQTTESGKYKLASFIDDQYMYRLYEKFILEYYRREHPELDDASAAQISWSVDDDFLGMLPVLQSDIYLRKGNRVLIIDAKYYQAILQTFHEKQTIRSGNLYQIFTYVKNQAAWMEPEGGIVSGMLLYAGTEGEIQPDESYLMSGNRISVKTLDLNRPFSEIREELENIYVDHFEEE